VQGLVVGLGHILCRAVIRDVYSGEAAHRMIAHASNLQAVTTILLPMLAGWLTWMWGWRAVFAFISAAGALLLLLYSRCLPETLPVARRQPLRPGSLWRNYRLVLGSAWFMRLTVAHSLNWAAMFLYVAAAPQVLTHLLGRSATEAYLVLAPMMCGLIAGFLCLPKLVQRCGTRGTLYLAYAAFGLVNLLNVALGTWLSPSLIHLLMVAPFAFAVALCMPLLVGQAIQPFPDNAGLAASFQMFLQYGLMAAVAGVLAPLLWGSFLHLAIGCAVLTCIGMALMVWQRYATHRSEQAAAVQP